MSSHADALFGHFEPVARDAWRAVVERDLKGADFDRQLVTKTPDGLAIQPLYTVDDAPRGAVVARTAQRVRLIQRHTAADPEVARVAIAEDLAGGVDGVTLCFDARTRTLAGAPAANAANGLVATDARRLARALEGIDLGATPVRLEAGASGLAAAAALVAVADRQRVDRAALSGSLGVDPLATRTGPNAVGSADDAMRHACAAAAWTLANAPGMRAIRLSTRPWHEAGAHAARDLAFTLAAGVSTLRSLARLGIGAADAARAIELEVAIGRDVFVELARLRAARLTWARVLDACGAGDAVPHIHIHAETSRRTLTLRDPWVNALRTTHQTLAALVGGADSVTVRPWDDRAATGSALGRRVARNTALVLIHESHLDHVIDPGAGSAYIEALTAEIAEKAWEELQELETAGGLWIALADGEIERRIRDDRAARDARLRTRRDAITGTSEFPDLDDAPLTTTPDATDHAARGAAEAALDRAAIDTALARVEALRTTDPAGLVDAAIAAAATGASITELAARTYADETTPGTPLAFAPDAAAYEALRDAADAVDPPPTAFAATWGALPEYKARLAWTTNLLAAGGVRLEAGDTDDVGAIASAFAASGHRLAVVAASDARYLESGPAVVAALRDAGAVEVWIAGRPTDALRDAGADRFVHLGVDVIDVLEAAHRCIGVPA